MHRVLQLTAVGSNLSAAISQRYPFGEVDEVDATVHGLYHASDNAHPPGWPLLNEVVTFLGTQNVLYPGVEDKDITVEIIGLALARALKQFYPEIPRWVYDDCTIALWWNGWIELPRKITPVDVLASLHGGATILASSQRSKLAAEMLIEASTAEDLCPFLGREGPTVNWHLRTMTQMGVLVASDSRPIWYETDRDFLLAFAHRLEIAVELAKDLAAHPRLRLLGGTADAVACGQE